MVINLQDRNIIVSYIQIILKEQFGVTLKKITSDNYFSEAKEDAYEITMNDRIKVTGTYNLQTYMSTALYMAFNYPREQFPYIWYVDDLSVWHKLPYDPDKLTVSMNKVLEWASDWRKNNAYKYITDDLLDAEQYDKVVESDYETNLTWNDLTKYYSPEVGNTVNLMNFINSKTTRDSKSLVVEVSDIQTVLVNVIVSNSMLSTANRSSVEIPERVLSYLLGEVVSPLSEQDEVLRIQKLIYYPNISPHRAGVYDDIMTRDIENYQKDFLSKYKTPDGTYELPESFSGFKVTGYVDPWTERIIVERS